MRRNLTVRLDKLEAAKPAALTAEEQFARNVLDHLQLESTGVGPRPPASFYDELDRRLSGPTGGQLIEARIRAVGAVPEPGGPTFPLD